MEPHKSIVLYIRFQQKAVAMSHKHTGVPILKATALLITTSAVTSLAVFVIGYFLFAQSPLVEAKSSDRPAIPSPSSQPFLPVPSHAQLPSASLLLSPLSLPHYFSHDNIINSNKTKPTNSVDLVPALTPSPTPTCSPSWSVLSSPNPGLSDSKLFGVSATSSNDAWAVGYYGLSGGAATLTLHWDGTEWLHIPSPNPNPDPYQDVNDLFDVDAVASDDVWAVGTTYSPGHGNLTLIEHWDGGAVVGSSQPQCQSNRELSRRCFCREQR